VRLYCSIFLIAMAIQALLEEAILFKAKWFDGSSNDRGLVMTV
jgi:hypothetical protein